MVGPNSPGAPTTIVLVEDEASVRLLLQRTFARAGYCVVAFGTGNEAKAWLDRADTRADLLLTDVAMPQLSGAQLASWARRRRAELPVLFMSGLPGDAYDEQGRSLNRQPTLVKPFTAAELLAAVQRAIGRDAGAQ